MTMNNYQIYEEIGKGRHSIVYKGRRKKSTEYYAIASIDKCQRNRMVNSVQILRRFDHKNIIKFHNWYETSNHLWVITEMCPGGDLRSILTAVDRLPENSIRILGADLAEGLFHMHCHGVLYIDLKPSNILLDALGQLRYYDFGLSVRFEDVAISKNDVEDRINNNTSEKMKTDEKNSCESQSSNNNEIYHKKNMDTRIYNGDGRVGSSSYMAPELFNKRGVHSMSSDIWGFGCVLYEMAAGHPPFRGKDLSELISNIIYKDHERLTSVSKPFAELVESLLRKDPRERANWKDIAHSEIFSSFVDAPSFGSFPSQPAFENYVKFLTEEIQDNKVSSLSPQLSSFQVKSALNNGKENENDILRVPIDAKFLFVKTASIRAEVSGDEYRKRRGGGEVIDKGSFGAIMLNEGAAVAAEGALNNNEHKLKKRIQNGGVEIDQELDFIDAEAAPGAAVVAPLESSFWNAEMSHQNSCLDTLQVLPHEGNPHFSTCKRDSYPLMPVGNVPYLEVGGSGKIKSAALTKPISSSTALMDNTNDIITAKHKNEFPLAVASPPGMLPCLTPSHASPSVFTTMTKFTCTNVLMPSSPPHYPSSFSSTKRHFYADDLLMHPTDAHIRPLVGGSRIEKYCEAHYNKNNLPFKDIMAPQLRSMGREQIEEFLTIFYRYLCNSRTSPNDKLNAICYFETLCSDSQVAEIVVNCSVFDLLTKLLSLKSSTESSFRMEVATTMGILVRHSDFIDANSKQSLIVTLLKCFKEENSSRVRRRIVACLSELLFYIATRTETGRKEWKLQENGVTAKSISNAYLGFLNDSDDAIQHYAVRLIENTISISNLFTARSIFGFSDVRIVQRMLVRYEELLQQRSVPAATRTVVPPPASAVVTVVSGNGRSKSEHLRVALSSAAFKLCFVDYRLFGEVLSWPMFTPQAFFSDVSCLETSVHSAKTIQAYLTTVIGLLVGVLTANFNEKSRNHLNTKSGNVTLAVFTDYLEYLRWASPLPSFGKETVMKASLIFQSSFSSSSRLPLLLPADSFDTQKNPHFIKICEEILHYAPDAMMKVLWNSPVDAIRAKAAFLFGLLCIWSQIFPCQIPQKKQLQEQKQQLESENNNINDSSKSLILEIFGSISCDEVDMLQKTFGSSGVWRRAQIAKLARDRDPYVRRCIDFVFSVIQLFVIKSIEQVLVVVDHSSQHRGLHNAKDTKKCNISETDLRALGSRLNICAYVFSELLMPKYVYSTILDGINSDIRHTTSFIKSLSRLLEITSSDAQLFLPYINQILLVVRVFVNYLTTKKGVCITSDVSTATHLLSSPTISSGIDGSSSSVTSSNLNTCYSSSFVAKAKLIISTLLVSLCKLLDEKWPSSVRYSVLKTIFDIVVPILTEETVHGISAARNSFILMSQTLVMRNNIGNRDENVNIKKGNEKNLIQAHNLHNDNDSNTSAGEGQSIIMDVLFFVTIFNKYAIRLLNVSKTARDAKDSQLVADNCRLAIENNTLSGEISGGDEVSLHNDETVDAQMLASVTLKLLNVLCESCPPIAGKIASPIMVDCLINFIKGPTISTNAVYLLLHVLRSEIDFAPFLSLCPSTPCSGTVVNGQDLIMYVVKTYKLLSLSISIINRFMNEDFENNVIIIDGFIELIHTIVYVALNNFNSEIALACGMLVDSTENIDNNEGTNIVMSTRISTPFETVLLRVCNEHNKCSSAEYAAGSISMLCQLFAEARTLFVESSVLAQVRHILDTAVMEIIKEHELRLLNGNSKNVENVKNINDISKMSSIHSTNTETFSSSSPSLSGAQDSPVARMVIHIIRALSIVAKGPDVASNRVQSDELLLIQIHWIADKCPHQQLAHLAREFLAYIFD